MTRSDARKLAERLRLHDLKPVYHGESGFVQGLYRLGRFGPNLIVDWPLQMEN